MTVTIEKLGKIFPKVSGETLDVVLLAMQKARLADNDNVAARFLGQLAVESINLTHTKEIGGENARYAPWFGRGYIQLTWKANYQACAAATGINCVNHPELLEEPEGAIASAIWFYTSRGLHHLTDVGVISKRVNGSGAKPESLAARRNATARALKVLQETA